MNEAGKVLMGIVGAIVSLAVLSVVLSGNSQTSNVIGAASTGLGTLISAAEAPVTGSSPIAAGSAGIGGGLSGLGGGGGGGGGGMGIGQQFLQSALSGGGIGSILGGLGGGGGGGGMLGL